MTRSSSCLIKSKLRHKWDATVFNGEYSLVVKDDIIESLDKRLLLTAALRSLFSDFLRKIMAHLDSEEDLEEDANK
jgi:hypothetical protein